MISKSQVARCFGGYRAFGGPVGSRTPYIVGEKGPELFIPSNTTFNGSLMQPTYQKQAEQAAKPSNLSLVGKGLSAISSALGQQQDSGFLPIPELPNQGVLEDSFNRFGGFRALGGPVDPNQGYVVGENGPELFVPNQDGTIVPNPNSDKDYIEQLKKRLEKFPLPAQGIGDQGIGNFGTPAQPAPPPAQPSTAEQIQGVLGAPASQFRKSSLWKRVGKGLVEGLGAWAQAGAPGGLAGALGAAATGSIGYGASPSFQAEGSRQAQLRKLWGRFQQESAIQQAQAQQAMAGVELQGKILGLQQKGLDYAQQANKPLYDSITADKKITPDEAAQLKAAGIIVTPYDAQKYGLEFVNGEPYSTPEVGPPVAIRNTSLPTQKVDLPVQAKSAITGTPVFAKGGTILETEAKAAEAQAGRDQRTAEFNASSQLEADKENVRRQAEYTNSRLGVVDSVLKSQSGLAALGGEVEAARKKLEGAQNRINYYQSIVTNPNATDEDHHKADQEVNKASKEFDDANAGLQKALGKQQGGQDLVNALQQQLSQLPSPQKVTFRPITPANPRNQSPKNSKVGTQADYNNALRRLRGK